MSQKNYLLLVSERLFHWLLHIYPADFREAYGREMALVFRESCRTTVHQAGFIGMVGLWLPTLLDVVATAVAERAEKGFHMSRASLVRFMGLGAIVAGLLLILFIPVLAGDDSPLRPYTPLTVPDLSSELSGCICTGIQRSGLGRVCSLRFSPVSQSPLA
jgi:hypothetical protein